MDNLDEMIKEEKREYHRKWRANNPDKVKQINANYWKRKAEEKAAQQQANRENQS